MPCSYCSRLLYPNQIKWITRQTNSIFPFEHVYPHIPLNKHPRNSTKVAVCPHVNYHLTHVSKTYLMANENICRPYIYTRALADHQMYPLTQNTDQLKVNLVIQKIYEHYHYIPVCWVRFSKTSTCLLQKTSVNGSFVFHSPVWRLFYPLFLSNSQRQPNKIT